MTQPSDLPPWATGNYAAGSDSWSATARRVATDITTFAATGLTPNLRTRAQSFNEWLARVQEHIEYMYASFGAAIYGDGSDGDLTVDGGTGDTNLTGTRFYENVTVDDGSFLHTDGYLLFVSDTLTVNDGYVQWVGNPGDAGSVGGAGGAAHTAAVLAGGRAGGAGGNSGANGTTGTSSAQSLATASGRGGTGGNGGGGTTGAAGGSNARTIGDARSIQAATTGHVVANGDHEPITGGAGGGGGGGGGGANIFGGGGGGGGGVVIVVARNVVIGVDGGIRANGGAGGAGENGGASAGGGGGGGGQGGVVYLVTRNLTNLGTIEAAGGAAGAASTGTPAGLIGAVGQAGYVISHLA